MLCYYSANRKYSLNFEFFCHSIFFLFLCTDVSFLFSSEFVNFAKILKSFRAFMLEKETL